MLHYVFQMPRNRLNDPCFHLIEVCSLMLLQQRKEVRSLLQSLELANLTWQAESPTGGTIKCGNPWLLFLPKALLLLSFWNNHFDTQCMICDRNFQELDPAIRTVSLKEISPLIVKVHNRHLSCIKEHGASFIPMSHVWHESIADANLSKKNRLDASEHIFKVLAEILPIVTAKFSPVFGGVELWHDYISIPQWNRQVQQALLLMLPHIYHISPFCLIYLDDVTSDQLMTVVKSCAGRSTDAKVSRSTYTTQTFFAANQGSKIVVNRKNYGLLTGLFRARWFQRM